MFYPIRIILEMFAIMGIIGGFVALLFGGWQLTLVLWAISAILGYIGRKVNF